MLRSTGAAITQVNTTMGNKTLHIKYLFFPAHSIQQQGALWIIWDPTINYSRFDSNKFGKLSVRKFLTWKPKLWRALLVFIVWNVLKIMITSMINNLLVLHKSVTPTVSKLKFNLGRGHWSWTGLDPPARGRHYRLMSTRAGNEPWRGFKFHNHG